MEGVGGIFKRIEERSDFSMKENISTRELQMLEENRVEVRKVWKIVGVVKEDLYDRNATVFRSCIVAGGIALTIYRVGEWTESDKRLREVGYGLCTFDSLDSLLAEFHIENIVIFEATAKGVTEILPVLRNFWKVNNCENFEEFVNLDRADYGSDWPKGTLMADMVRLDKRVENGVIKKRLEEMRIESYRMRE